MSPRRPSPDGRPTGGNDTAGDGRFRHRARRIAAAWLGLLALMLASLGAAYVPWPAFAWVPGIAIALLKTALVAWVFMHLGRASPWTRVAAVVAVCALLVLWGLTGLDRATRPDAPAAWQNPGALPAAGRLLPRL